MAGLRGRRRKFRHAEREVANRNKRKGPWGQEGREWRECVGVKERRRKRLGEGGALGKESGEEELGTGEEQGTDLYPLTRPHLLGIYT